MSRNFGPLTAVSCLLVLAATAHGGRVALTSPSEARVPLAVPVLRAGSFSTVLRVDPDRALRERCDGVSRLPLRWITSALE